MKADIEAMRKPETREKLSACSRCANNPRNGAACLLVVICEGKKPYFVEVKRD